MYCRREIHGGTPDIYLSQGHTKDFSNWGVLKLDAGVLALKKLLSGLGGGGGGTLTIPQKSCPFYIHRGRGIPVHYRAL